MVSGIVGAGGNLGGMMFGFLFKAEGITYVQAFSYLGIIVITVGCIVLITRFQKAPKAVLAPEEAMALA